MVTIKEIESFLKNNNIAIIGASKNKKKFGYIVFDFLKKHNYTVFPVNPALDEIDGIKCYKNVENLPENVKAAVFITKPEVTEKIVEKICELKTIRHLWFQKGAENSKAIETAIKSGKNTIYNECILMFAKSGFPHNIHRFFKKNFGKYPK